MKTTTMKADERAARRGRAEAAVGTRGLDGETLLVWARERELAALAAESEGAEADALRLMAGAMEARRMARGLQ